MDKHKKPKKPKHSLASLDGIVADGRQLGVQSNRSYQPNRDKLTPSLDNFVKRSDGFHPMRQSGSSLGLKPEVNEKEALLDAPIVLDDAGEAKSKKKGRRFSKRQSKKRKFFKRFALATAVVLLVGAGYLLFKFYNTQKQIFAGGGLAPTVCNANVEASLLKGEGDGRVNILLLGNGGAEHSDGPDLTDTLLVVSLDTVNNKSSLLSIPRDLWVQIPGNGSRKVNEAYYHGKQASASKDKKQRVKDGIAKADETIEQVIGVPIHYHVLVSFAAFRESVNAVGGVDINVPKELAVSERLWDEATGKNYYLNVRPGQQHFDGQKALFFSRSRYTSIRGDFDRSERQRLMLLALKDKILSAGTYSNPIKVSQLLDSLGNNVYTDFDTGSIKCLYKKMSEIPSSAISSLDLVTPPHDFLASGNISGFSTLVPKAGLYNYTQIQSYVRNSFRDAYIAKENASVAVYNATSIAGLATKKADELKSYGYNITTIDNTTTSNPAKTVLVDMTKGVKKYTKHYLEARFKVIAQTSMPAGTAIKPPAGTDFVIILGEDASTSR